MSLSGQQYKKLQKALLDAFPNKASLEQMLLFELDRDLDVIATGANLEVVVFQLIKSADSQGWIEDLVASAYKSNPGNSNLQAIAQEIVIEKKKLITTEN
ncbi:effector-associated domain EAD1-containing protein [Crinalium epipsammum]|uniref:effector-associated domain EAD1-containing protein n=1 Tax=Crinalium epipsammum TaxID=241425 RepID=UPI00059C00D4|nr:effector-associated domain EAD1-containing protein [Crinalium epipsammum]